MGRFCAEVQQVHSRELEELYSIREGLTQRQVLLSLQIFHAASLQLVHLITIHLLQLKEVAAMTNDIVPCRRR